MASNGLVAAFVVTVVLGLPAMAGSGSVTPGNLLISTDDVLYEYTPAGVFVQSIEIPYPAGNEDARDVVVAASGLIHVYNGTFDPYLSSLELSGEQWSHQTFTGWSTVANGTYGGIATRGRYAFVTDMRTFGDNGDDEAQGIIRIDLTDGAWTRFAEDIEPIDLNLGLDGLLYALYPGGSPGGREIDVYDPVTLTYQRTIDLVKTVGFTPHRAIAVNAAGKIFVVDWDGELQRLDADGFQEDVVNLWAIRSSQSQNLYDVDVSPNGTVAVGDRSGGIVVTDEDLDTQSFFILGDSGAFVHHVPCVTDTNLDTVVDVDDLLRVILGWQTDDINADVNGDGNVDGLDIERVIDTWGRCGG